MAHLLVRKTLRQLGILDSVKAFKRKFYHAENAFKPADPRLLISMQACLAWLRERDLLEGRDYLEFGIFRGFNLWYVQAMLRLWGVQDCRFYGFDSFFGLPEVTGVDKGGPFQEGDFYAGRHEVEQFFNRFGIDWSKTKLVEGFFSETLNEETLKQHEGRQFSLCVVDSDLYSSAKEVLDYIVPLMGSTSILWFDDWGDFGDDAERGEQLAFRELQEAHPELKTEPFIVEGGSGQGFIVRRSSIAESATGASFSSLSK